MGKRRFTLANAIMNSEIKCIDNNGEIELDITGLAKNHPEFVYELLLDVRPTQNQKAKIRRAAKNSKDELVKIFADGLRVTKSMKIEGQRYMIRDALLNGEIKREPIGENCYVLSVSTGNVFSEEPLTEMDMIRAALSHELLQDEAVTKSDDEYIKTAQSWMENNEAAKKVTELWSL